MAVTSYAVSTYTVNMFSSGSGSPHTASVLLLGADGKLVAWVMFYPSGATAPANEWRSDVNGNYAIVGYPESALPTFLDVLRNEKPLIFWWFDYTARRFGGLGTSSLEPIGEAERA